MHRSTSRPYAVLAAAILTLSGCASDGSDRGDTPRFTEGILTYHDPAPARTHPVTRQRQRLPPATIILTTRDETGDVVKESDGTIYSSGRVRDRTPQEIFRAMTETKKPRRVIPTAAFAGLWDDLVDRGLLTLPRHAGATPPVDRAYIQVQAEGRALILLKPLSGFQEVRSEDEIDRNRAWHESVVRITEVFSQT